MLRLLNMGTTVYNIETRIGKDGKPYIMEITPRGGGNRLSEMVRMMTGVDFIEANVMGAIGQTPSLQQLPIEGYWAEIILHAPKDGVFAGVKVSESMHPYVVELMPIVQIGQKIEAFRCASDALGTIVLKFDTEEQLNYAINNQTDWLTVEVD